MTFFNILSSKKEESPKNKIQIDNREKNSLVPSELVKKGFAIEFKQLPVADYILNDIAIERKTISDLKSSIINKRIFSQLLEIKQYPRHFLMIEGNYEDLFNNEIISGNAIRGFLLSLSLEYQIPVIYTENEKDSALYLSILSNKKDTSISLRAKKSIFSREEQVQFILEGFPNIGPATAEKLISKFKSLHNIFSAKPEDLQPILGKKTQDFLSLLD